MIGGLKMIFLIMGAVYMFIGNGCTNGAGYEKYSSKDPELGITIDYVSGWHTSEQRGSYGSFAQVVFYEVDAGGKDKGFGPSIIVTVEKKSKVGIAAPTLQGMQEDLINKRMQFKEAKVISVSQTRLLGALAQEIELSYKALDKDYALDAKLTPVKEKVVILEKNEKFYTLRYVNREEDFNKFEKAFGHMINTVKLKKQ